MCFKELQIQAVLLPSPLRERGNSLKFPPPPHRRGERQLCFYVNLLGFH